MSLQIKILSMTYALTHGALLKNIALTISAVLVLLLANSCDTNKTRIFKETRVSLFTIVTITVYSDSQQKAKTAIDATYNELDKLGKILNFYSEDSEVSMINRSSGIKPV
ncbi:MAG: hypothetical protein ABSB95_11770, partial [Dissulfurispiraceae bacterium]